MATDFALSVRQPWAWLLAAGIKDIENRTWPSRYLGPFYIHASKTPDEVTLEEICQHPHYRAAMANVDPSKVELKYGGIIGKALLVDCVKKSKSVWFEGPHGFLIRDAELIDFIPCRGMHKFFPVKIQEVTK